MSSVSSMQLVSVKDYLEGELTSDVKHEYLSGVIYAIAGGRVSHDVIGGNVFACLHAQLRGKHCRVHTANMKIRCETRGRPRFYYPDAMVVCESNPPSDLFQDRPVVVVEVLSRGTRRIDEGEKKDAYLGIDSLKVYLLVEQEAAIVTVYRKDGGDVVREYYPGLDAVIGLREIDVELPLVELYEDVEFTPEPDDDEDD